MNSQLHTIQQSLAALLASIQIAGKTAFDNDDPVAAKKQAERLEQIDRAEALISELDAFLNTLGISSSVNAEAPPMLSSGTHKPDTARHGRKRLADGPALHPPQLAAPVVDLMRELGGTARLSDIWAGIERKLGASFTMADLATMKNSSLPRWKYNVQWTLTNLKNAGQVEHTGKRGVWRVTSST